MEDMLRDCGAGVASTGPSDALGEGEEGEESSCVWAVRILGETCLYALLGEERELPWGHQPCEGSFRDGGEGTGTCFCPARAGG